MKEAERGLDSDARQKVIDMVRGQTTRPDYVRNYIWKKAKAAGWDKARNRELVQWLRGNDWDDTADYLEGLVNGENI
jgi:hypothetical protein